MRERGGGAAVQIDTCNDQQKKGKHSGQRSGMARHLETVDLLCKIVRKKIVAFRRVLAFHSLPLNIFS